jgi:hypothetical protein
MRQRGEQKRLTIPRNRSIKQEDAAVAAIAHWRYASRRSTSAGSTQAAQHPFMRRVLVKKYMIPTFCGALLASAASTGVSAQTPHESIAGLDQAGVPSIRFVATPASSETAPTSSSGFLKLTDDREYDRDDAQIFSLAAASRHDPFGTAGSVRLNFQGGYARDVKHSRNRFGLLGAGVSYFIIENLSFDVELNGMYVDQRGRNSWAANVNFLFRWHFLSHETWSLYVDGGAGIFAGTHRVPRDGTSFNFTPQIGMGVSFEIAPDLRLMTGLRWFHISNANTSSNNPGRDHIHGYVSISLPF